MNVLLRNIGATIAGVLAGGLVVAAIEGISSSVYPAPPELDLNDPEQLAEFVSTLPVGAFLFVLVAWAAGSAAAAAVGRRFAWQRRLVPGAIAAGVLLAGAVANLFLIPHPLWFWFAGIAVFPVFGLIGLFLVSPAPDALLVDTSRQIKAPLDKVFLTLSRVQEFSKAVPHIVKVEFLTEQQHGAGTKFRETRLMRGKEVATELEVAELVENDRVRMVSDAGGTIWDTLFTVQQQGEQVLMTMVMEARPYRMMARCMTPLIMPMVSAAVEDDMDAVKRYCENPSSE